MRIDAEKLIKRVPWFFLLSALVLTFWASLYPPEDPWSILETDIVLIGCALILFVAQFIMKRKVAAMEDRYKKGNQRYAKRK